MGIMSGLTGPCEKKSSTLTGFVPQDKLRSLSMFGLGNIIAIGQQPGKFFSRVAQQRGARQNLIRE